jgi:hypothetical protein
MDELGDIESGAIDEDGELFEPEYEVIEADGKKVLVEM